VRKSVKLIFITLTGFFVFASVAVAERIEIKSKVMEVNSSSGYIKVDSLNQSGEMKEIKINIERNTLFNIYQSIQDVKVGDNVTIDADFNAFSHEWKAIVVAPYNQESIQKILETSESATSTESQEQAIRLELNQSRPVNANL